MSVIENTAIFFDNPLGVQTSVKEIEENFEFLDDWEERYGYIIDLGKQAPSLPDDFRIEDNYIHGCQSQVWFVYHFDTKENKLYVLVDSDAMIVRGLAAVVMAAFNGRSPKEIAEFDMEDLFKKLDLLKHLSPTRGNGLRAMVQKIQNSAQNLVTLH